MSIKDRIFRAKSKISIKTYKRPQVFIILMMILINIIILLIAAFIALLIDKTYTNYLDALTNGSLKWMLTPNAILLIDNPNTLFLAHYWYGLIYWHHYCFNNQCHKGLLSKKEKWIREALIRPTNCHT